VRDFRVQCRAVQVPPFSPSHTADDHAATPTASQRGPKSPPRPTAATSAWPQDGACAPASPGCSCSCRC
jgi:hypothetical protein